MRQRHIIKDELPEGTVLADGFDRAFVGISHDQRAVYDIDTIIDILVEDGMTAAEALEYFEYNIAFAYVGPQTPIYIFLYNFPNTTMPCNYKMKGKSSNKGSKKSVKKGGKR